MIIACLKELEEDAVAKGKSAGEGRKTFYRYVYTFFSVLPKPSPSPHLNCTPTAQLTEIDLRITGLEYSTWLVRNYSTWNMVNSKPTPIDSFVQTHPFLLGYTSRSIRSLPF